MNKQQAVEALELKLAEARKRNDLVGLIALCHEMEALKEKSGE